MGSVQEYQVLSTATTTISSKFQEYYCTGDFLDTTLVCRDGSMKAHRMVIAAQSKFFEDILIQNPCQNPVIVMMDMDVETLKCLVDYMYAGKVILQPTMLDNFVKAANIMGLSSAIHPIDEDAKQELQQQEYLQVAEMPQEGTDESSENMAVPQLMQVQALENAPEGAYVMETAENVDGAADPAGAPTRTIFLAKKKSSMKVLGSARASPLVKPAGIINRTKRFDVIALRRVGESGESSIAPRKDVLSRIESGLIPDAAANINLTESLDEVVSAHFEVVADEKGVRTHQCLLCPHTATFPSNMKRHIMGHLGIKPFKCAYCDFQSTLRGDLNVHLKKRHPDCEGSGIIVLK